MSGKILDYATRNKKCVKCDKNHKEDHDCRKNFYGSAKAMEADAGVQLVNHSKILKDAGLQVRVIIGDEDSSMIAAVRKDDPCTVFYKLADTNHLIKNFSKEIFALAVKHKQLNRKGVIKHIVQKCFTYAVTQNKGQSKKLGEALKIIPDHLFGHHQNCGGWCKKEKKHTVSLSDELLYKDLVTLFHKYAANSEKFSVAASSQINESFNNIVAHKAPKNICLSKSAACDIRVADGVCTLNDGEKCVVNYKKSMKIPTGSFTESYVVASDRKRLKRKIKSKTIESKVRRLECKQNRENSRKANEQAEGVTYASNCGFEIDKTEITEAITKTCDTLSNSLDDINVIYFDLETTDLSSDAEIIQIAAKCNEKTLNLYVNPARAISADATNLTGFRKFNGILYQYKESRETISITEALAGFARFINKSSKSKKCLLVAHNATFDKRVFLTELFKHGMMEQFYNVSGIADTYWLFKKELADRKGPDMFKLEVLAKDFLPADEKNNFHDALYDVITLQKLVHSLSSENNLLKFSKTFRNCCIDFQDSIIIKLNLPFLTELKGVLSLDMIKRFAVHKIKFQAILDIYNNEGSKGIVNLLTEKVNNKVRITSNTRIKDDLITFLKTKAV